MNTIDLFTTVYLGVHWVLTALALLVTVLTAAGLLYQGRRSFRRY